MGSDTAKGKQMRLTNEKIREFIGDSAPTTDGGKVRLVLAGYVLLMEQVDSAGDWRENEIVDDMLRIADKLDTQSGGVAPE